MTYKSMVRQTKIKKMSNCEGMETLLDQYLKEGTDQGWTLHKMHISEWNAVAHQIVHLIWETND